MASKPIKKVLASIRNGKSIALAIAESDLDPEERDILVMSILDIVRDSKRMETKEEWAQRIDARLGKIETAVTALIDHEAKTREAFVAMAAVIEQLIRGPIARGFTPRLVERPENVNNVVDWPF